MTQQRSERGRGGKVSDDSGHSGAGSAEATAGDYESLQIEMTNEFGARGQVCSRRTLNRGSLDHRASSPPSG